MRNKIIYRLVSGTHYSTLKHLYCNIPDVVERVVVADTVAVRPADLMVALLVDWPV